MKVSRNHSLKPMMLGTLINANTDNPVRAARVFIACGLALLSMSALLAAPAGSKRAPANGKSPVVKLKMVRFETGIGGGQILYKSGTDTWENDRYEDVGDIIFWPQWQDNNLDGDNTDPGDVDEPACHVRNSKPEMTVFLSINPQLASPMQAKLRARAPSSPALVYAETDCTLKGKNPEVYMVWSRSVGDNVRVADYELVWELSTNGGAAWTRIGKTTTTFFIPYAPHIGNISLYGAYTNQKTCVRMNLACTRAGNTGDISVIASNIQEWRDMVGIDNTGVTARSSRQIWGLLDPAPLGGERLKGQCGEGSLLMESMMKMLGIEAEYQHVYSAVELPVPVHPGGSYVGLVTRSHCGTTEKLHMWLPPYVGDSAEWNDGAGSCMVNDVLYTSWACFIKGKTGDVVHDVYGKTCTAKSPAHSVLLQLESGRDTPYLQRWRKADTTPCNDNERVPVPLQ